MPTTPRRTPPVTAGSTRGDTSPTAPAPYAEQHNGGTLVEEAHPIDELLAEAAVAATAAPTAPSEHPPAAAALAAGAEAVGAWLADKRVTALWSINQNRNVYMGVGGVGWKKFANNSDSAIVAFTILSSHARATQSRIDYREEADGMVHECYIW
jgi:hypothetical protein